MSYTVGELIIKLQEFPRELQIISKGHFVGQSEINYLSSSIDGVVIHISRPNVKAVIKPPVK